MTFSALIAASILAVLSSQVPTRVQDRQTSPSPPDTYDPVPGPFIIYLGERGSVASGFEGVVANAVRNWTDIKLSTFSICFRAGEGPPNWNAAHSALATVATALKVRGARLVVMPSGGGCERPYLPRESGPHIEIMGMVRL